MLWSTKSINHNRSAFQPKAPTQEKKVCRITRYTFFFIYGNSLLNVSQRIHFLDNQSVEKNPEGVTGT